MQSRWKRVLASVGVVCASALWAKAADATVVRAYTLEQKVDVATVIVRGKVEAVESRWAKDNKRIHTFITMRVLESIKGTKSVGSRVTFMQGGGRVGEAYEKIAGNSPFSKGEEAVVFLEPIYDGTLVEIAIGIAKYGVQTRARGEKFVTHTPHVGLAVFSPDGPMRIEEAKAMEPMPLSSFVSELKTVLGNKKRLQKKPVVGSSPN